MRKKFLIVGLVLIFFSSCISKRVQIKSSENKRASISESEELEYKYSLIEGIKQKSIGSLNSSLSLFNNSLSINENSAAANFELANIYIMSKNDQEALKYAKRAVELDSSNIWYRMFLGQLYYQIDSLNEAIREYKFLVNKDPQEMENKFRLGALYSENGEYDKAIELYEEIKRKYGANQTLSALLQENFINKGDIEEAINEGEFLYESDTGNFEYIKNLARLYDEDGQYLRSERLYLSLLKKDSTDLGGMLSLNELYYKNGMYEEFIKFFRKVLEHDRLEGRRKFSMYIIVAQDEMLLRNYRDRFNNLFKGLYMSSDDINFAIIYADFLLKMGDFKGSYQVLKDRIDENMDYFVWEQFLNVVNFLGDNDSLIYYALKAISIYPDKPIPYFFGGLGFFLKNDYKEAKVYMVKGIELINEDNKALEFQFYTYLMDIEHRLNNYEASDRYFSKAYEIDSTNLLILNNYSYYLALRKINLELAKKLSYKTILESANNSTYLDTYAWILYQLGDYEHARTYIEKAINNLSEDNDEVWEHYGDILLELDHFVEAVEAWKRA
ncbi:tetratricopeptide repeat protein, partial [Bacteroidota bacterium]